MESPLSLLRFPLFFPDSLAQASLAHAESFVASFPRRVRSRSLQYQSLESNKIEHFRSILLFPILL